MLGVSEFGGLQCEHPSLSHLEQADDSPCDCCMLSQLQINYLNRRVPLFHPPLVFSHSSGRVIEVMCGCSHGSWWLCLTVGVQLFRSPYRNVYPDPDIPVLLEWGAEWLQRLRLVSVSGRTDRCTDTIKLMSFTENCATCVSLKLYNYIWIYLKCKAYLKKTTDNSEFAYPYAFPLHLNELNELEIFFFKLYASTIAFF